jgi:hypothetical protein
MVTLIMADIPTAEEIAAYTPENPYSPFHGELDEKYPINKMLAPDNMADVSDGAIPLMKWVSIFNSSPARNSEAEMLMGQFVIAAARAGQWIDIPHREDEALNTITLPNGDVLDFSHVKLEFTRAGEIMVDKGLAKSTTDDDGKEWYAPTDTLLDFIAERLKPYGPEKGIENKS